MFSIRCGSSAGGEDMVRRKIIVVDSCKGCPHLDYLDYHCTLLSATTGQFDPAPKVPGYILKNNEIWCECPLDDAGGFL